MVNEVAVESKNHERTRYILGSEWCRMVVHRFVRSAPLLIIVTRS